MPPEGYLEAARRVTSEHGALLWIDEVQTGMGRTGDWFAHGASGVTPDLVTVAKGLGGGVPIGACIGLGAAGELLQPGNHGTTFGGNPVATAAGLAVVETIESEGLLQNARTVGDQLRADLATHPLVAETTGRGLLVGIVLTEPVGSAGRDGRPRRRPGRQRRDARASAPPRRSCSPPSRRPVPPRRSRPC